MNFYFKETTRGLHAEAWVEVFCDKELDWRVTCEAKLLLRGDTVLIDAIETKPQYRKKGYATKIINELKIRFNKVEPIGILPQSKDFWDKLGMVDALGDKN